MIINISCPIKRDKVKELLLSSENPKFTFVKMKTPMEMQFEVTYQENEGDAIADTKRIIKSTDWGRVLNLRILEEGKLVSW